MTDANELARQSNAESDSLFKILSGSGGQQEAVNTANAFNGLRVESSGLVDRARDLDAPDDVSQAQDYLVETLGAAPRRPGRGGRRHPRRAG